MFAIAFTPGPFALPPLIEDDRANDDSALHNLLVIGVELD
jgi:hypothetical protein